MRYDQGNADELKTKFWKALDDSPFLFLQRDGEPQTAVPMTAQTDKEADSAIWFFTQKNSDFAKLGPVTATYESKGHDVYARFHGSLFIEDNQERFEHFWNNFVKAWYDGGKDDPDILFLRMDLREAEIWSGEMGLLTTAKMAMGMTVHDDVQDKHAETTL
ncbi:pyridoxamine 5'-phosphate oxidase family protein [Erythrobacter ani]|uniref:Pyridoxamine 5'-phosphate oxidase family protein n=1 Tax=Erythrobacter ani TaxID=2827235 RepID=A0ABS6SQD2_9SPHN|nr:pyridoxamine 5'-phosphate oxidase family protein [Erythrobacter ani]MBV7267222.1 pyridoxamine 5'-phosphate oxidase family protein [Erythrobacter ani]